eukprot:scaffold246_cov364-Pavlova_lutheri.AAC.3
MLVVAHGSPDNGHALTAKLDCLVSECEARLQKLREWWSPQVGPTSPRRSAESFTDDENSGHVTISGREALSGSRSLLALAPTTCWARMELVARECVWTVSSSNLRDV